jgi:succinoglycan biosynthesis protein ExoO
VSSDTPRPLVSVIMANFNGEAHIATAVRSVLGQSLGALELILSDDGSTDGSLERARVAAAGDERLRILEGGPRSGPGAARNRAIAVARGDWLAIVDSDDVIHRERLARLLAAAERDGADIVADDKIVFYEEHAAPPHAFLKGARARGPTSATAADYADSDRVMSHASGLGYLKPVIRRAAAGPEALRYDESLKIAEDYDLIVRLLLGGARMRIEPGLWYFYRKHEGSISHRLGVAEIDAMLAAHDRQAEAARDRATREALGRRRRSLEDVRAFCNLVDALKAWRLGAAVGIAVRRPAALWLLRRPVLDRLGRRARRPAPPAARPQRRIALLSRQRIIGATNGSSGYILALSQALSDAGYAVDFVGASPKVFGRWPALRLRPETAVFANYAVRGGLRFGPIVVATDPRVAINGALAAAGHLLAKLIPAVAGHQKPASYAIAAQAQRDDLLYVARQVRPRICAVLCDYAFLAPLAPYALAFDAPIVTVMHDLISARVRGEGSALTPSEVASLSTEDEIGLLSLADLVVAIQGDEEAEVRRRLPAIKTVIAPFTAPCVEEPQIGDDDTILFVGSNTAPNITGLNWFLLACWPLVLDRRPGARLLIAGSVGRAMRVQARGVRMLGVVDRLDALYRSAGVVVAPLLTGSGLKIKLIEALAAGKAIVGTSISAQGVAAIVEPAMVIVDEPAAFAAAVAELLADRARRTRLAQAALACANAHFPPSTAYEPFIRSMEGALERRPPPPVA